MNTDSDKIDFFGHDFQSALFASARAAVDSLPRDNEAIESADLVNEVNLTLLNCGERLPAVAKSELIRWAERLMVLHVEARIRNSSTVRRGGHIDFVSLRDSDSSRCGYREPTQIAIEIREALRKMNLSDPRLSRVVELRFFQGYHVDEAAEIMGLTAATVKRLWRTAKLELARILKPEIETQDSRTAIFRIPLVDHRLIDEINRNPELLHSLNWRVFEELIAELLSTSGYEVELMAGTKDGGVDVVAFKKDTHFGTEKYLVQAKRWSNSVGVEPVRELLFLRSEMGASKVCMATTSRFTKGAWALGERHPWQLELRDFEGIREWVRRSSTNVTPNTATPTN